MKKQEWVKRIESVLQSGKTFHQKTREGDKTSLLFATDVFRRAGYRIVLDIEPSETQKTCLTVTICSEQNCLEFTLRREDRPIDIINQCNRRGIEQVSIRGCGTVINSLFVIADWALHNGWFVEKNVMSTLTQVTETQVKHRNTTLHLVMKRGSLLISNTI